MFLARVFFALTVSLCTTLTTQAMSRQPVPMSVSYAVGAYRASPVIYKLTINGQVLSFSSVAASGASRVPPDNGRSIVAYFPRLPAPDDTRLDIKVEWTEIWSGQRYQAKALLNEEHYPWFEGKGLRLNMIFEDHGGFAIRIISEERWKDAVTMSSTTLPTLEDYPIAFETCAPRQKLPALSEAEISEQLSAIWGVDVERLEANRNRSLPPSRCVASED